MVDPRGDLHRSRADDVKTVALIALNEHGGTGRVVLNLRDFVQRLAFRGREAAEQVAGFQCDHALNLQPIRAHRKVRRWRRVRLEMADTRGEVAAGVRAGCRAVASSPAAGTVGTVGHASNFMAHFPSPGSGRRDAGRHETARLFPSRPADASRADDF